jgi:hypothetical protein
MVGVIGKIKSPRNKKEGDKCCGRRDMVEKRNGTAEKYFAEAADVCRRGYGMKEA